MRHQPGKVIHLHRDKQGTGRNSRELLMEWFELHRADLLRYGRRILPSSESAEDLVQDVFHRLLRQDKLDATLNPRALLMTVARNAAIDRLRRLKAAPAMGDETEDDAPGPNGMPAAEMVVAIEQALAQLPPRTREVFVLRRFRGLETGAVAQALGISPRMVQKHLANAMAHIRRCLGLNDRKIDS